jgi:hypothetical protein
MIHSCRRCLVLPCTCAARPVVGRANSVTWWTGRTDSTLGPGNRECTSDYRLDGGVFVTLVVGLPQGRHSLGGHSDQMNYSVDFVSSYHPFTSSFIHSYLPTRTRFWTEYSNGKDTCQTLSLVRFRLLLVSAA